MHGDPAPRILIRHERSEDLEALAELLLTVDRAWGELPYYPRVRELGVSEARRIIRLNNSEGLVVVDAETIVGYGALRVADGDDTVVTLTNVMVDPMWRGVGIGRMLVEALCDAALTGDRHLHLQVLDTSEQARAFYLRLGFTCYGRKKGAVTSACSSLMCLTRDRATQCRQKRHL